MHPCHRQAMAPSSGGDQHWRNPDTTQGLIILAQGQRIPVQSGQREQCMWSSFTLGATPSPVAALPSFGQPSVQAVPVPCPAESQLLLLC